MISRGRIILSYIMTYIILVMWSVVFELLIKAVFHHTWERFERMTIEMMVGFAIIVLFLLVKEMLNWEGLYGKIYPILKTKECHHISFRWRKDMGKPLRVRKSALLIG